MLKVSIQSVLNIMLFVNIGVYGMIAESGVIKKVLNNGFTVLVRKSTNVPKVGVQLFYNVGSKDEKSGQRGLAHLIEHMIFKGTKRLSESDINMIAHKLSGYINAFTSYDWTGYLFELPSQHWYEALPILSDCMRNCTFKQEYLNSEMKAVIQELKMYNDNYTSTLIEKMVGTIFADHPYHYPIIGFKQDLWSVSSQTLLDFYHEHYIPNNATLVVVGDIEPDEVFALVEKHFGSIVPNFDYKKSEFYHGRDIVAKEVVVHRDVKQPEAMIAFEIPGESSGISYVADVTAWLLGSGKSSRLYKKIVDELQLATSLQVFPYVLFDQGLFFIYFQPTSYEAIDKIKAAIFEEFESIRKHGLKKEEVLRAAKQNDAYFVSKLENLQKQLDLIGTSYLATGNEHALATYIESKEGLVEKVTSFINRYFKQSVAHSGKVVALDESDKELWLEVQDESDKQDARILAQAERTTPVEPGVIVDSVSKNAPKNFSFPKPTKSTLENGLKVLVYHNKAVPKVDLVLSLKAKHYYDPAGKEGVYSLLTMLMEEGTKNYPGHLFLEQFENRGMMLEINPGTIAISCLKEDVSTALELLNELITNATLPKESLAKVKQQITMAIDNYWDEPSKFVGSLIKKEIYKDHPYAKESLGTHESIKGITHEDVVEAYKQYISPDKAVLALSGDIEGYDINAVIKKHLVSWETREVEDIIFPAIPATHVAEFNYPINRDQVVLAFAGKSVTRYDEAYDKILLFDQIFTGGVLGSMSSRLFDLREQSGLFYTIGGSLLANVSEEPGMIYVRTIVSKDRLEEAEKAIEETIRVAANEIADHEFEQAQDALVNSLVEHFESNKKIAYSFIFIECFDLPDDYFDTRAKNLLSVSKAEVIAAIKKYLSTESLMKFRVGRV